MSHPANDPYNEAKINVLKHSEKESHDLLTKKGRTVKHMRKWESKASKIFPKNVRRYSAIERLEHKKK